ncbi:hypothetical protein [Limisalsivibrio acetivorans]|uniref:hypothetical protein n=1 Tax=Limisalsivibrio acetivorans TaxID=1304888 RepID=UPI0003B3BF78|nr:hypothetical protein [Limisalsivibrio acetivorans]
MAEAVKEILLFPQNEVQVQNMLPVAEVLRNEYEVNPVFLDMSGIYHQELLGGCPFERLEPGIRMERAFYLSSPLEKVRSVRSFIHYAEYLAERFGLFVMGNDGALQRVLMDKGGLRGILLLDGILSNKEYSFLDMIRNGGLNSYDIKQSIRSLVARTASGLPFSYYLPSEVGSSKSLERIFVASRYIKELLTAKGVDGGRIEITGVPRFGDLVRFGENLPVRSGGEAKELMLVTQGYLWHNENIYDELQQKEIASFIDVVGRFKDRGFRVNIRVHPRDDRNRYEQYTEKDFVSISTMDLAEDIARSDGVFGFNSTVLIQALMLRKPAFSLMRNGQFWRFQKEFTACDEFIKIYSDEELFQNLDLLKRDGIVVAEGAYTRFVSEENLRGAENIARRLNEYL